MPNAAQVLFPLCPFRDLEIINELVCIAEVFNGCLDVVAQLFAELNVTDAYYLSALACIDHIVLDNLLQH